MDGAFPRYSAPLIKQQHYGNSFDEARKMRYSSSSSSSSNSSRQSYSPPSVSSTPQRVPRKPVSNNPMLIKSSPTIKNEWKTSSPTRIIHPKDYHQADTIHPNKSRVSPSMKPTTSSIISSSSPLPSSTEKYIRTRRHSQGSSLLGLKQEPKPTFWYPRLDDTKEPLQPLKRGLSKKIRGLLKPHRMQIEQGASNQQSIKECQDSLKRSCTPHFDIEQNPFHILSHTKNEIDDDGPGIQFQDFSQIDNYAMTVQQRGPLLTPTLLSQKFLVRPYKRDLFRLRAIFIWIVHNIRPDYHQKRNDLILLQKQLLIQPTALVPSKSSNLKQRLSRVTLSDDHTDEVVIRPKLDAMDLLQEEFELLLETENDYIHENADNLLETRTCQSSFGMAHLFMIMAVAAGFEDAQVIHGYLKAPKDTDKLENNKLPVNHAWCSVKIDGEYRFIDCWLASPFYAQNETKMESHWFLTQPLDMMMTHLPIDPSNQFLDPPLTQHAFFSLPHVRKAFFWHELQVIDFKNVVENNSIFYLSLKLKGDIHCYAETEGDDGTITRGLAQCLTDEERICKIKAVLPPSQSKGWLKIYTGNKLMKSYHSQQQQQEIVHKNHYTLAMCIRIRQQQQQQQQQSNPFEFVQLYMDHNEFYIQEPQCYRLYPLQKYNFSIRGNRLLDNYNRATHHHKLAIKSPGGRLIKLMYYPQDQTYDGTVTVSEVGKWSLICLLHHTGGWYTVATWSCHT